MVLWGFTGSKAYHTTPRSGIAVQEWKVTRDRPAARQAQRLLRLGVGGGGVNRFHDNVWRHHSRGRHAGRDPVLVSGK